MSKPRSLTRRLKKCLQSLLLDRTDLIALKDYRSLRKDVPWINFWRQADMSQRIFMSSLLPYSKSQHGQDLFAACHAFSRGVERGGFFVEFGATDGLSLSNSWLLEHRLGWGGIVAEPARIWHETLKANRNCIADFRCVTDKSHTKVKFLEASQSKTKRPELSTILAFADSDGRGGRRRSSGISYEVETISLVDLLDQHGAPRCIDFLSVDTEGSELLILSSFDFAKYRFRAITVEHNRDASKRQALYDLLTQHGYERVHADISMCDDWYIDARNVSLS